MPAGRATATVEGDVQGVGYCYEDARSARRYHLTGRVANLDDGRVEIVAEGDEPNLKAFLRAVDIKRPPIHVASIRVRREAPTGAFTSFQIATGKLADEMIEGFATGAAYFGVSFEKQDKMLAKQDEMLAKQDGMLTRQDQMLSKQDATIREMRGLRRDLRSVSEERFTRLEGEIREIKARIGMG